MVTHRRAERRPRAAHGGAVGRRGGRLALQHGQAPTGCHCQEGKVPDADAVNSVVSMFLCFLSSLCFFSSPWKGLWTAIKIAFFASESINIACVFLWMIGVVAKEKEAGTEKKKD